MNRLTDFKHVVIEGLIVISAISCAAQAPTARHSDWATRSEIGTLENCYLISDGLYRSEQPSKKNMQAVQEAGVKTLLNLRRRRKDNHKANGTELKLERVPINAWRMDYDDVVVSLRMIRSAEKPVLLHCIHGSDRTGAVAASYRMLEQGWTKEAAIDEFLNGGYGYHANWFPKILKILQEMDVEKLRADVERQP